MSDESAEASAAPKLTKKQRRKAAQRKQLLMFLGVIVLVAVVAGAVLGIQKYMDSRDGTKPADLRVTAVSADGEETELAPWSIWADGDERTNDEDPSTLDIPADGEITLKLPSDVYDHDWTLLQVYDDEGANSSSSYAANEAKEVTIEGSSSLTDDEGNHPRLIGVEIQSVLIDDSGDEEEPVVAVWSIAPKKCRQRGPGGGRRSGVEFAGDGPQDLGDLVAFLTSRPPAGLQDRLDPVLQQGDRVLHQSVQLLRGVLVGGTPRPLVQHRHTQGLRGLAPQAGGHVVLDPLAGDEFRDALRERSAPHVDVVVAGVRHESEALVSVEPLHLAGRHVSSILSVPFRHRVSTAEETTLPHYQQSQQSPQSQHRLRVTNATVRPRAQKSQYGNNWGTKR